MLMSKSAHFTAHPAVSAQQERVMSEEKEIQTGPQEHPGEGEHFFENSKPVLFQDKEEA